MTAFLGSFGLAVGLCASVVCAVLWLRQALGGSKLHASRQGAWLMLAGAVTAAVAVEWALVRHDFSLRFVAENGSRETSLYYTVTSLWSSLDGSLLLWLVILTGYVAVVAYRPPRGLDRLHPWAMTVMCTVAAFFFGLTRFAGRAFDTVTPVPSDGPGPNPLLQDHPAMGVHPPLLYLGFIGMSVPFAYAIAALVTGEVGREWLAAIRGYTLFAWVPLTAGIVMGAWWSYAVLGWGGYWAWDPVENASLLPWLVATALLHSAMVQRRRGALPAWNVALAVSPFILVCLGTFLTRSDVVASVHSFTQSAIGPVLLGFVVALCVLVAVLVVLRSGRLGTPRPAGGVLSRGTALLLNNLLLICLTFTVLLGTLFPLAARLTSGQQLSVGPPYYNRMAVPAGLVLLLLMAFGPLMRWEDERAARLLRRAAPPIVVGACLVAALALAGVHDTEALLAYGLAAVVAVSVALQWVTWVRAAHGGEGHGWLRAAGRVAVRQRRRHGGLLAHLGLATVVVGLAASSTASTAVQRELSVGSSVTVSGVTAQLVGVSGKRTPGAMNTAARLRVRDDSGGTTLRPELRYYVGRDMTVTRPAIRGSLDRDVYLTLLQASQDGRSATVRVAVNPLVGWIWAGGALTALGGLVAAWPRRKRVAVVERTEAQPVAAGTP